MSAPPWCSPAAFARVMLRYPWLAAAEGWSAPSGAGAGSTRQCCVSCSGLLSAVITVTETTEYSELEGTQRDH